MSCPPVRLRDVAPPPQYMASWERFKHTKIHLFTEMIAEMLGVFLYVYAGAGSTAGFVVGNITSQPLGSLFTVGAAYSLGIMLAIACCSATSGGHFNPAVTISFVLFKGFPMRKAVMYILAQIFGAYLACLIVYGQWKDLIIAAEDVLVKNGSYDTLMFTPRGPAGIFGLYVMPGTNLGQVFLNEFVTDFVIGIAISGALDPTNYMVPPAAAPWVIAFTYGFAIWGFSPTALAANTARDLGARFMTMSIWGRKAAGGPYAAIAALTNIPATVIAFFFYETFLGSSSRTLTPQHAAFLNAHRMHREENGLVAPGPFSAIEPQKDTPPFGTFDEKGAGNTVTMIEVAGRSV